MNSEPEEGRRAEDLALPRPRPAVPSLLTEPVSLSSIRFENLAVGQSASLTFQITEEHVAAFAHLTGDHNPIHVNAEEARRTRFRTPIVHGLLLAAPISTLIGMLLVGRHGVLIGFDVNFAAPAHPGDRIVLRGVITQVSNAVHGIVVRYEMTNADTGRKVACGRIQVSLHSPTRKGRTMKELRELKLAMDFSGRVALVTGASRGIGEATARLFALHGAAVSLTYFQGEEDARAIADDIQSDGGKALALRLDVRDLAQVAHAVQETLRVFGRLDILVNNAVGDYESMPFEETGWDDMADDLACTVQGAFHCIQAVLPAMEKQGAGHIINIGSRAVDEPVANHVKYITAKAALLGMTRALAAELGPRNIRVNAVSPGLTDTDLTAAIPEAIKAATAGQVPLRRLADSLDIAKAVLFLASPYADYVHGHQLVVSGGK